MCLASYQYTHILYMIKDTMRAETLVQLVLFVVCSCVVFSQPTKIIIGKNSNTTSAMPGQSIELKITILYDQQPEPVVVTSNVVEGDAQLVRKSGESISGFWLINGTDIVSFTLQGTPNQTVSMSFLVVENKSVSVEVDVHLVSCALGFEFSEITRQCVCDEELAYIGIYCEVDRGSIIIPPYLWLGPVQLNNGTATLGYTQCPEDYCISDTENISNNDFNFQCKSGFNRSGVGCGSCMPNYSAILGSKQWRECTHTSLILTLFFLVTGVLTVVGIAVLRITVTEGYLNAVLFYSNIANLFAGYFSLSVTGKGAFFLTAWISQNFGIPACFYDGMTMIAVTGLHLLYVVLCI